MSKMKSNLDEMQEQKLLKIEHNGVWIAFWGLLIAMVVQVVINDNNVFSNIIGEWVVFMVLAIYLGFACVKNGIWDRKLKPNFKTNMILSLVSSTVCGIIFFTTSYMKYNKMLGSIATGGIMFIQVFILTLAALGITVSFYKKRVAKLEKEFEE